MLLLRFFDLLSWRSVRFIDEHDVIQETLTFMRYNVA